MATEVREWLYKLFPKAIRVWTALDIDHRDGWFQELILNLERCDIAIMCVTRESAFSRWLNFEAGFTHAARSRCRMVPLLLEDTDDAEGFDLVTTLGNKSPLKELHVERVDKTAAWKIVAHIVNLLNGRIEIAPGTFDEHFASLRRGLAAIGSDETGFFGRYIRDQPVALLAGGRKIDRNHLHYLEPCYQPPGFDRTDSANLALPEEVDIWLAGQDIRAATYLSQAFGKMGCRVETFPAETYSRPRSDQKMTYIAMGLGFNKYTVEVARKEFLPRTPLFEVGYTRQWGRNYTDEILFGPDRQKVSPSDSTTTDVCLVARIVEPNSIMFVCAGQTAHGTAVAGYFLANEWRKIMSLYVSTPDKRLEFDSVAAIVEFRRALDPDQQSECDASGWISERYKPYFARRSTVQDLAAQADRINARRGYHG